MSLINKAASWLVKKAFDNPQTSSEYNKIIYNWIGNGSIFYNPENDEAFIKDGYQHNATVYAIIQMIINNAAVVPFQVFEVSNKTKAAQYKALIRDYSPSAFMQARVLKERAFEELHDTDLHELLYCPNPSQGYAEWLGEVIGFGKLTGNRYIYGISPETGMNAGKPGELYVLPSQHMEIVSGGFMQPIKAYRLNYNVQQEIDPEQICHIKDFNPNYDTSGSHLYGQSPLMAAFRVLAQNNEAVDTSNKMLQNQAARGILASGEHGGINELQSKQLDQSLKQKMRDNRGGIAITPATKLQWINFGLSPTDLQVLEQIGLSSEMICQAYQFPAGLLGLGSNDTYENQKEYKKALFQNCVIPELNKIKDEFNRWLVPAYGGNLYLDFDYTAIPALQDDMEKVSNQLAVSDWLTINEKRAVQNYEPKDDNLANELLVQQGLMPLNDLDLGDIDLGE